MRDDQRALALILTVGLKWTSRSLLSKAESQTNDRNGVVRRSSNRPSSNSPALDFPPALMFKPVHSCEEPSLRAADRDEPPMRGQPIPEANTRQRDAPPGAFVLFGMLEAFARRGEGLPLRKIRRKEDEACSKAFRRDLARY